jgi:hypothetical protein
MVIKFREPLIRSGALLGCLAAVSGCSSVLSATTADVAGVASAGITSGVTKNAAVGTGIGLGVAAAANAALGYAERRVHRVEQERIAAAAGPLAPGQVAYWSVVHDLPIESDEHGRVTVYRTVTAPGFVCKEIVFSVEANGQKAAAKTKFYTTTICFDGRQWQWAEAEPATARWGALQ